jgi:hypothetical protein
MTTSVICATDPVLACVQVAPHIKACDAKFEEALVLAKQQHEAAEAIKVAKAKEAGATEGKVCVFACVFG